MATSTAGASGKAGKRSEPLERTTMATIVEAATKSMAGSANQALRRCAFGIRPSIGRSWTSERPSLCRDLKGVLNEYSLGVAILLVILPVPPGPPRRAWRAVTYRPYDPSIVKLFRWSCSAIRQGGTRKLEIPCARWSRSGRYGWLIAPHPGVRPLSEKMLSQMPQLAGFFVAIRTGCFRAGALAPAAAGQAAQPPQIIPGRSFSSGSCRSGGQLSINPEAESGWR